MKPSLKRSGKAGDDYGTILRNITGIIIAARGASARSVNCIMTATYWLIGQRIIEFEQSGEIRAEYGEGLLKKLSSDLIGYFGRGFSRQNLQQMRLFYLYHPIPGKCQTPSGISDVPDDSNRRNFGKAKNSLSLHGDLLLVDIAKQFPLPWSAYVRILAVKNEHARQFYEAEALRGGWSVRQLDRQIDSQFYERTALSRNKAGMIAKGRKARPNELITADEAIKDPYVLEFLDLKDEYSETELEDALIKRIEAFLMELGGDFCFIGRQRRFRIGDDWYRVDLLFFHRRLRCLVIVDLKIGKFTHADAGQMHLYLNYAQKHWTQDGENPPVGLILCARKDDALARYALDRLPNKILAAEYRTNLPNEEKLVAEIKKTRALLETRKARATRR